MIGANDGRNEKAGRDHRAAESRRSNGLGWANERIKTAGRGNHFCRVDLLLIEKRIGTIQRGSAIRKA